MLVSTIIDPFFTSGTNVSNISRDQDSSDNMDDNTMLHLLLQANNNNNNNGNNTSNSTRMGNALGPSPIEVMVNRSSQQQQQNHPQQNRMFQTMHSAGSTMNMISSGSSLSSMLHMNQQQNIHTANAAFRRMSGMATGELNLQDELSPLNIRQVVPSASVFPPSFFNNSKQSNGTSLSEEPDLLALMTAGMMNGGDGNNSTQAAASFHNNFTTNNPLLQQVGLVNVQDTFSNAVPSNVTSCSTGNGNDNAPSQATDSYAENGILGPWSAHAAGLLGGMMQNDTTDEPTQEDDSKKSKKKPKDKPKRPLSAYNIFFKEERNRILDSLPVNAALEDNMERNPSETSFASDNSEPTKKPKRKRKRKGPPPHGKIGFESLAKLIGKRWQELDAETMKTYKAKADADMQRYKQEMAAYKERQSAKGTGSAASSSNNLMLLMMQQQQQQQQGIVPHNNPSGSLASMASMFAGSQMNNNNGNMMNASFDLSLLEPQPIMLNPQTNNNSVLSLQQMQQMLQQQIQMLQQQEQQQQQQSNSQGLWGLMTGNNNQNNNSAMGSIEESPIKKPRMGNSSMFALDEEV
jgi:hypothetical protein